MQSRFFQDPQVFLRGTPAKTRKQIAAALADGRLTIEQQEIQAFKVNTTFKRPEMKLLSALLDEGASL